MDKKIEVKVEQSPVTPEPVKPGRIKIRKLPERPLGLIQGN